MFYHHEAAGDLGEHGGGQWAAIREPYLLLSRNPEPRAGQLVLDKWALVARGQIRE